MMVADSEFLPAHGGGEREHVGFVRAATDAGWLSAVVIPVREPLNLDAYRAVLGDVPVISTHRRTGPLMLMHPRYPYVVASRPFPAWLPDRIQAVAPDSDGVVTFSYKSWRIGERLAITLGLPMVIRQHNLEGAYHRSLADGLHGPRRLVMRWEARRIERDERKLDCSGSVSAIADISADDAAARLAAGAHRVLHVPPFAFDTRLVTAEPGKRDERPDGRRVLFVGALDVVTNVSALRWLLEHVWRDVRARLPDLLLDIVGRKPSPVVRALVAASPGTELYADVPDVLPFLHRATIAVNPAIIGSGVNIKLVDYLLAGLPVVTTGLATRGLALRADVDLVVADSPAAFADGLVALLGDPARAERLAASGQARIQEMLDPRRNLERLADGFAG